MCFALGMPAILRFSFTNYCQTGKFTHLKINGLTKSAVSLIIRARQPFLKKFYNLSCRKSTGILRKSMLFRFINHFKFSIFVLISLLDKNHSRHGGENEQRRAISKSVSHGCFQMFGFKIRLCIRPFLTP